MPRPGSVVPSPDELRQRLKSDIPVKIMNDLPVLEISSSCLRRSLENGHSIRYLVPRSVEQFIKEHGLYGFGTLARGSG
jgi:nicotinic acid mononucleotide adenylyltransferase